ncbi:DNA replication protein [Rouxiella sp. Mn2063]|uniref:DNA replication protein n=1 Tax=Rouxiella sp. Mn2063 TaxID=3395262 RepID=UPI003BBA8648
MSNVVALRKPVTEKPEATGKGFALLHRKITELPFYGKDSEAVHLWVHFILTANHAPAVINTEFGEVLVRRGEFLTGRNKLELATGIDSNRIKYLIGKFEKLGMVSKKTTKKFSLICVTKYDEYQPNFVPTDYQQSANTNPDISTLTAEVVPTDCQQSATNNELNNNSITKVIESVSSAEKAEKKKPTHSCEDVIAAYHRILPECPSVRALSDKRRNQIRTFWAKAGKITRQLDGAPFSMAAWEAYLEYIALNCRWMLGARPDGKTGKTWRCKNIDYLLSDEVYLKVREGNSDDN